MCFREAILLGDFIPFPNDEANRIFCIKGGPGVGKSSFMKSIAAHFVEMGYDVEHHHCSSDSNSLDGVVIKQAKVAILDGTTPHIMDPKTPGAVDEILNFGAFWDEDGLKQERKAILKLNKELKGLFNSAYHYLRCAKELQDDIETTVEETVVQAEYGQLVLDLKMELFDGLASSGKAGRDRHLFHNALTPDGRIDYIDTIISDGCKCCLLEGANQKGASEILYMLANEYLLKGYNVEIYHQPLNPERLETILVEKLNLALTIDSKVKNKSVKTLNLDEAIISEKLLAKDDWIKKDKELMETLLNEAFRRIKAAKLSHDKLEKYYIPQMDFVEVTRLKKQVIEKIMSYL